MCACTLAMHLHTGCCCTGYGGRRPRDCWLSAWLVALEVIYGQLLDAITLGIIFARIAHPKNRARTVFISDSAVIARRDGALKFMFRVADVRQTQVLHPSACQPLSLLGRARLRGLSISPSDLGFVDQGLSSQLQLSDGYQLKQASDCSSWTLSS